MAESVVNTSPASHSPFAICFSAVLPPMSLKPVKVASTVKPRFSSTCLVMLARSCSSANPFIPILTVPLPVELAEPPAGQLDDVPLLVLDELPHPASTAEPSMATAINLRLFI